MTFTIADVCEELKLSRATLIRMIKRGEIKAFKIGDNWRITREELERIKGNERR